MLTPVTLSIKSILLSSELCPGRHALRSYYTWGNPCRARLLPTSQLCPRCTALQWREVHCRPVTCGGHRPAPAVEAQGGMGRRGGWGSRPPKARMQAGLGEELWVQLQTALPVSSEVQLVIGTQGGELSCIARCPAVCASAMACGSLGPTQVPDSRSRPVLMPGPPGEDVAPTGFSFPPGKNAHRWKIIHTSAHVSEHLLVLVHR